jgi:SAM-dependent methyltransferase
MRQMATRTRYDAVAAWYDQTLPRFTERAKPLIREWLGRGPGRCIDLGCGGGVHLGAIAELGWFVVGVDESVNQLLTALRRRRARHLMQADVAALPFPSQAFDAAVAAFIHTDVDDWNGVVTEVARVLRPGGRFVYVGTHPCFIGPFSRYPVDQPPQLFTGYRRTERTYSGPGLGAGLRRRVGVRHVPLSSLQQAVIDADFHIERVAEPGPEDYPRVLAVAGRRR